MGCRLPKLRREGEERSPGKIFSTLRRPQVETKVGVAYTYHFLDFLLGKEEVSVSSVLCLSSVRELPVQVRELYGQGFVLVAVHPFVHPCGPRPARVQRQLHRAVLIRETHSSEKTQLKWAGRRLEADVCVAGQQAPDPDVIQNYVKKIQDAAEQGVLFVGFLQQPGGGPCFLGHMDPEDLSSLHSSPSPIRRHPASTTVSTTASPSEPTIPDLISTESTEPHQNLLQPEHDRNTEVRTPEYKSVELRTIEQNPTDTSQVELDWSSTEPVENTQDSTEVESTDREHNHSPVRIPSIEDQPNHSPDEAADPPERLQSPSPIDPACDHHNHVPTELSSDQDQLQSCNPIETTCIEGQQNESQVDFIRTLLPNFSPAELTHGLGGPDADRRHQGDRQSPSPQTQNQRLIPKQDHGTDNLVRSPELDNGDRGSESWTERGRNHGNRGTGGDLDKYQRSSRGPPHNNNNHIRVKSPDRDKRAVGSPPAQSRGQLFALYNHTGELSSSLRSYSLRVPLGLQREAGLVTEVDAHWLDHMTQHFISGARLIDGFFHLGDDNDSGVFSVDIVFIFQSSSEETPPTSYDAIVVEQWTIVDGVVVRTDYIPLLQSLAPYGWRLMCVLPTPIVKTNSDGSLSTKQILFLQRPTLQRKRKDFKKLNLRGRNKAKKNSAGEMLKEERKNMSPVMERGMDEQKRNTEEEESEARRNWDNNRNEKGRTVERGGLKREEEERECETESQEDFPQGTEGVATDLNQEVERENGKVPLARQEKAVRFAYVNQKNDEVKSEEKITQQLSERALFSGVC
ncbi:raftlin [Salmo trutta]|uniref:Raftlin, lipid raft linker 1a n=1 Tax=Salmo trutta TaxID=8032 RepID=A0A674EBC8_SALTR|nr:raftlin-like [Salmo trutta]